MQNSSTVTIIPWDSTEPPSESVIRSILAEENLKPYAWGNNPGDVYQAHTHEYDKVIYVKTRVDHFWSAGGGPASYPESR